MDQGPHHSHFPAAASPVPTSVPISPSLPAPGEPNLKAPEKAIAWRGETLKVPCHSPCKFFSYEKYWCKWSNKSCKVLPSQDEASRQASVNCDQNNQLTSLILNPDNKDDEGWYWCGVKDGPRFGDTVAVYVEVKEKAKGESSRPRPAFPWSPEKGSCRVGVQVCLQEAGIEEV